MNDKDLDKTRVKLFPNFTRHHLITHTNIWFRAPELPNFDKRATETT